MAGGACLPLVLQHQHLLLTSCRTCRARCAQESTHAPTTVRAQRCSRPERVVRASAGVNGHSLVPQCLRLAPTETAVPIWLSSLLTGALRPSCLAARASGDRALRRRNRQHFPCPAPPRAPPAAAAPAAAPGQLPPLPTRLAGPRGAAGRLLGGAGPAGPSRSGPPLRTAHRPPCLAAYARARPMLQPVGPEHCAAQRLLCPQWAQKQRMRWQHVLPPPCSRASHTHAVTPPLTPLPSCSYRNRHHRRLVGSAPAGPAQDPRAPA